jgi:hypothetical protein
MKEDGYIGKTVMPHPLTPPGIILDGWDTGNVAADRVASNRLRG